jgi:UPF0755 protein
MKKRLSKSFKRFVVTLEVILFILVLLLLYNFFLPLGNGKKTIYFTDGNLSAIINDLRRNGYNITDWDHYLLSTLTLPAKGWYELSHTNGGRYHFFKHLKDTPAKTMKIKVYAGETKEEIVQRLANDLKLDESKLMKFYLGHTIFQEADIFAGTYEIARSADENSSISYLFEHSEKMLKSFEKNHFIQETDHNTIKLLLTIASIIQKETNDPKEMPLIASVIYNRLEKNMKLQMDGTLNYGKYSHSIVTPERIKNDNTYYNTYKYKGLPPAPLAAVSMKALKAALYPAESKYLFFMLNKEGGHVFSETYKKHLASLKAFREYQKEKKQLKEKGEKKKHPLIREGNRTKKP